MKYATFSHGIWLMLFKTCSCYSILQQNLTFSLLTWLGSLNYLLYSLERTTKFLQVILNKTWMMRFFAVVNYMVRKFSFCSNLYADVSANKILLHIYINLKIVFISWKMILKIKSFILINTFIIHKKVLTSHMAVDFVDETRYYTSTSILKVLLKQYMSPTGPNKYLRGITPRKTDKLKLDLF